jgi:hypothetical protein
VDEVGGPYSDVIKLAGLVPSVTNLLYLWTYQIPEYGWWSPARNRKAAKIGLLQAEFAPTFVDHTFHVSGDQHEALLWSRTNIVFIYHDEPGGLRTSLYVKAR